MAVSHKSSDLAAVTDAMRAASMSLKDLGETIASARRAFTGGSLIATPSFEFGRAEAIWPPRFVEAEPGYLKRSDRTLSGVWIEDAKISGNAAGKAPNRPRPEHKARNAREALLARENDRRKALEAKLNLLSTETFERARKAGERKRVIERNRARHDWGSWS